MAVTSVSLQYFRCHELWQQHIHAQLTTLVGANAAGKTSLLEAIYLAATGRSVRANKLAEVVRVGSELARVRLGLGSDDGEDQLEIMITTGMVQGKKAQGFYVSLNGVRKTKKILVGKLPVALFRPEDMRLIEGSPGRRREFLDLVLAQTDQRYANNLRIFEQALRRRNKLLQAVRAREIPRPALNYYNQQLLETGSYLQTARATLLTFLSSVDFSVPMYTTYVPSLISATRMAEYAEKEIAAGRTLIGPQKDDFLVTIKSWPRGGGITTDLDVMTYGSRGQQRLAVVWLKAGELAYLQQIFQTRPLLLLDDIHSELDETSWQWVNKLMSMHQTIITTTHYDLLNKLPADNKTIYLETSNLDA